MWPKVCGSDIQSGGWRQQAHHRNHSYILIASLIDRVVVVERIQETKEPWGQCSWHPCPIRGGTRILGHVRYVHPPWSDHEELNEYSPVDAVTGLAFWATKKENSTRLHMREGNAVVIIWDLHEHSKFTGKPLCSKFMILDKIRCNWSAILHSSHPLY